MPQNVGKPMCGSAKCGVPDEIWFIEWLRPAKKKVRYLSTHCNRLSIFFFLLHFAYIYAFRCLVLEYREPPELLRFQSSQN
jgi:hypothetical protein